MPAAGKGNASDAGNLPGMGGIYNSVNGNLYHYAGNNPVKYVDPDGCWIDNNDGTYTAEKGDTLWGLYGKDWKEKSGYKGDPTKLQIGTVIGKIKLSGKWLESKTEVTSIGADIIFNDPSSIMYTSAKNIDNEDGCFYVAGHGGPNRLISDRLENSKVGFKPNTIARLIKNHPNYHEGDTVVFLSCHLGEADYAQEVANCLGKGVKVKAADTYVNMYNNGFYEANPNEPIMNEQGFLEPVESTRRNFKCFIGE